VITVTVRPDDGEPYVVTVHARDVLVWEKTSKGNKTFIGFMANMNMTDLYQLARIAAWRQGFTTENPKDFEEHNDVVFTEEEQEPEPDPTLPGPSPEPSSTSHAEPESPRRPGRKKASGR
jgi:hypothetical protein